MRITQNTALDWQLLGTKYKIWTGTKSSSGSVCAICGKGLYEKGTYDLTLSSCAHGKTSGHYYCATHKKDCGTTQTHTV